MSTIQLLAPARRALPRVAFGAPILSTWQARSLKRYAAVAGVAMVVAGWIASAHEWHHQYPVIYGWMGLSTFLVISTVGQLLSVLPSIRIVARLP